MMLFEILFCFINIPLEIDHVLPVFALCYNFYLNLLKTDKKNQSISMSHSGLIGDNFLSKSSLIYSVKDRLIADQTGIHSGLVITFSE
jgi:hypothetical protein